MLDEFSSGGGADTFIVLFSLKPGSATTFKSDKTAIEIYTAFSSGQRVIKKRYTSSAGDEGNVNFSEIYTASVMTWQGEATYYFSSADGQTYSCGANDHLDEDYS